MRRRDVIALLGGAAMTWPSAVMAQQADRARRIAVLVVTGENDAPSVPAFRKGLEKLGWTVGHNLQIDDRWGISDDERARAAIAELLRREPDVILAIASPAVKAAQQATRTIPIVFVAVSEPVSLGFVASIARPGGNITGFTNFEPSIGGKWVELLREIAPRVIRIEAMVNPEATSIAQLFFHSAEAAASQFALEAVMAPVHTPAEIEAVMMRLEREPGVGLILPPDTFTLFHHRLIVELAARYRLPAIYAFRNFPAAGGLVSYGPDVVDQSRRAASYVDRILRGEKPGDLPVQQPIKYELVINLKTANALGLSIPPSILARADEVIE